MRGPMEAFTVGSLLGSVPYYMSRTNHASLLDVALILSGYVPFPPSSRQSVNFRQPTDACIIPTVLKAIEFSTNVAPPQISTTLASR
jgi:hypothetical protein